MKTFWNRAGWLGIAVCALLASLALQIIMGVIAILPAAVIAGVKAGAQGVVDMAEVEAMTTELAAGAIPWGVFLYHILSLPVFGLWYYFGCGRPGMGNPVKVLFPKCAVIVLVIGFGLNLLANGIAMVLQFVTPALYEQYVTMMEAAGMGESAVTIIASVLLAPIGEELLCRGIILHCGRKMAAGVENKQVAFWIANTVQALFFGIMHGNFIQGTYAFVLGLGLGFLVERYRSLYPAMLCHFVINFLSVYVMGHLFSWVPESLGSAFVLAVAGAVISAAAMWLDRERVEN